MNCSSSPIGSSIAVKVRDCSSRVANDHCPPNTLGDLLDALNRKQPKQLKMFRTTAVRLSEYLNKPIKEITLLAVASTRGGFRPFLISRKYKPGAARSYVNFVRMLLQNAAQLGWNPTATLSQDWQNLLPDAKKHNYLPLVLYLAETRTSPIEVSLEDADCWVLNEIKEGRFYEHVVRKKYLFWRSMRDLGYAAQLPKSLARDNCFGIRVESFPESLRAEVLTLLKWKQAPFSIGRPDEARIRPATAKLLKGQISRLYGFAVNIKGMSKIESLPVLVQKQIVEEYVEWSINERQTSGESLLRGLVLVFGAMRQYPPYMSLDLNWFKSVVDSIPTEGDDEKRKARKRRKFLELQKIEAIPAKIRAERAQAGRFNENAEARLAMFELLVMWLFTFAWRQKNIREFRIKGSQRNLFKARIEPFSGVDLPGWVVAAQQAKPESEFWQFSFTKDETKMKHTVHAILPRHLVGPLEEYLDRYRPKLLKGRNPDTLFVNQNGNPLSREQMTGVVSMLMVRYGGVRVTPHLFRDIVAFTWLKEHPDDYLTLSKILWHQDVKTTIDIYGEGFNESSGVRSMESWLEQREARAKSK